MAHCCVDVCPTHGSPVDEPLPNLLGVDVESVEDSLAGDEVTTTIEIHEHRRNEDSITLHYLSDVVRVLRHSFHLDPSRCRTS